MSEVVRQESPLTERIPSRSQSATPAEAGVILREAPRYGYLNLRGSPDEAAFGDAVEAALGIRVPLAPNTTAETERYAAFWLGPNEWYLRTEPDAGAETAAVLEGALAEVSAAVNDGSSGVATLALEGAHARHVLEKGCTLDLHPRVFGVGQCAQTLLAKAAVIIRPTGDGYELIVRRSFADYLYAWIADAADEFAMAVRD